MSRTLRQGGDFPILALTMNGLRIETFDTKSGFPEILTPAIRRLGSYFLLIDTQSGPFNITDKDNFLDLEREISGYAVDAEQIASSSTSLWRPGILQQFGNLLIVDEGTYFVAFEGPEADAVRSAAAICKVAALSKECFDLLSTAAVAFLVHVDGWWELYSLDPTWTEGLLGLPGVSAINSSKWHSHARHPTR